MKNIECESLTCQDIISGFGDLNELLRNTLPQDSRLCSQCTKHLTWGYNFLQGVPRTTLNPEAPTYVREVLIALGIKEAWRMRVSPPGLVEIYAEEGSLAKTARRVGLSVMTVKRDLLRLGVVLRPPGRPKLT